MRLLKWWSWLLLAIAVLIYVAGIATGEFNRQVGIFFWGTSTEAAMMTVGCLFCLLLSITSFLTARCLRRNDES